MKGSPSQCDKILSRVCRLLARCCTSLTWHPRKVSCQRASRPGKQANFRQRSAILKVGAGRWPSLAGVGPFTGVAFGARQAGDRALVVFVLRGGQKFGPAAPTRTG